MESDGIAALGKQDEGSKLKGQTKAQKGQQISQDDALETDEGKHSQQDDPETQAKVEDDAELDKEKERGPDISDALPTWQHTRRFGRHSIEQPKDYAQSLVQQDRLVLEKYAMYKTESVRA